MNKRSTEWLIDSLRLKIENSFFTHQANHEFLTDLPNHRPLKKYIENSIMQAEANNSSFAVLSFSINRIEVFNSGFGYQSGDIIIKTLAKRLQLLVSELNNKYNKGTYRFLSLPRAHTFVIVINPIVIEDLLREINSIFSTLNATFYTNQKEVKLSGSIGVCIYPQDGEDAETLQSNSHAAMFVAKQKGGGNQVEFYKKEINDKTPWKLEIENELHYALKRKELMLHFQPIIDTKSKKIYSAEALLRWKHSKHGFISPADFIDIAEETGLIIPIGYWVFEEVCKQIKKWQKFGVFKIAKVSINVSIKQLYNEAFLRYINNMLHQYKISPSYIDFELTETQILDEKLVPTIKAMIDQGFSISIDDFGTGYSSMSYLKSFKVEKVKIDKSFIDNVTTDVDRASIVSAMLAMAKELDIKTVAEGVEELDQLKFLQDRNCTYIQGFYFCKPLPAVDFVKFMQSNF